MRLIPTEATVERVLVSPDVAAIFRAGFGWLEEQKANVLDMWITVERESPVRLTEPFRKTREHFERLLNGAAASAGRGPGLLNETAFGRVRKRLTQLLSEAETDSEAAQAVLALLIAIDERMGWPIRTGYYSRRDEGTRTSVPVMPQYAMPKPWPAFGTESTPFHELAPGTGVDGRRLFLEHQFSRVLVPMQVAGPNGPRPALHRSGALSSGEKVPCDWNVAAVDLLSALDELHLGMDQDHFWLQQYADDDVRDRVWRKLEWALGVCREGGAHLLVIPELTLSRELISKLASELGEWPQADSSGLLPMVVAGSLHEPLPGETPQFRNRPAIITPDGELDWDYWKLRPFRSPELERSEVFGPDPKYVLGIDTPLGRVAVTICLDFPDYHIQSVLRELRTSVVVVPAMTPGRTVEPDFYTRAAHLTADSRAATIFANSSIPIRLEIQGELEKARKKKEREDREGRKENNNATGADASRRPRMLSFVRGSTAVSSGTPVAADEFDPDSSATVCIYRLRAVPGGRLDVKRDQPRYFPG